MGLTSSQERNGWQPCVRACGLFLDDLELSKLDAELPDEAEQKEQAPPNHSKEDASVEWRGKVRDDKLRVLVATDGVADTRRTKS